MIKIHVLAEKYLEINPERFTNEEKKEFREALAEFFRNECKGGIADAIFDFFVNVGLVNKPKRHEFFLSYLLKKYSAQTYNKVMDVGAGRMCHLSAALAKHGFTVDAIDPNIRLTNKEGEARLIHKLIRYPFICHNCSPFSAPIEPYDLLVGLEPCDATEHIIRQSLKYNKPFEILLCCEPHHSALTGESFTNLEDWHNYLKRISSLVKINPIEKSFIATNN